MTKKKAEDGYVRAERDFVSANILRVRVSSNCPKGGDAGHGGVTTIEIIDEASTAWDLQVDVAQGGESLTYQVDQPEVIRLTLYGDTENQTIAEALRFAADVLMGEQ